MRKIIYLVLFLFITAPRPVQAYVAENSAQIKKGEDAKTDTRKLILKSFLDKKQSPLTNYTEKIIQESDKNNLDWRLIPAITGVESSFGKRIPYNSYNAYGWANGNYSFNSWDNSIEIVSDTLNNKYVKRGARKITSIAKRYAPPSPTWASKVIYFVNQIDPSGLAFDID
jgi:hypothetical protein